jgi:hypothetical protein
MMAGPRVGLEFYVALCGVGVCLEAGTQTLHFFFFYKTMLFLSLPSSAESRGPREAGCTNKALSTERLKILNMHMHTGQKNHRGGMHKRP